MERSLFSMDKFSSFHAYGSRLDPYAHIICNCYSSVEHSHKVDVPPGNIVELVRDGRREMICLSGIDATIAKMNSGGAHYLINRQTQAPDGDD